MATDALHLLDCLEAPVSPGRRVPLSSKALIDEREFLDLVDQLRVAIPAELRQAQRLVQDREQLVAAAKAEAAELIRRAEARVDALVQQAEIVKLAEQRATAIVRRAEEHAAELRGGAEGYARDVLGQFERDLERTLRTVRRGRRLLEGG